MTKQQIIRQIEKIIEYIQKHTKNLQITTPRSQCDYSNTCIKLEEAKMWLLRNINDGDKEWKKKI